MRGILFALASTLDFHTNRLLAKQGRLTTKKDYYEIVVVVVVYIRRSDIYWSKSKSFFPPIDVAAKQATT